MEMKNTKLRSSATQNAWLLLFAIFFLGALAGCLLCGGGQSFAVALAQQLIARDDPRTYFLLAAIPLAMLFAAGFFSFGKLLTPVVFFIRGAVSGLQTAQLAMTNSASDYLLQAASRFLPDYLVLNALVLLGRQALLFSNQRRQRPDSAFFYTAVIGLFAALLATFLRELLPR